MQNKPELKSLNSHVVLINLKSNKIPFFKMRQLKKINEMLCEVQSTCLP